MKRDHIFIASVALVVAAAAGCAGGYLVGGGLPAAASPPSPPPPRVQTINGESVLQLETAMQRAGGIAVTVLATPVDGVEATAYASVIDPQPLFDQAQRLATARAERDTLRIQAQTSQAQYERVQALYDDEHNMSARSVQEARAAALSDQARLSASGATCAALAASLRLQFGEALAQAAEKSAAPLLQHLAQGQVSIARVTQAATARTSFPDRVTLDAADGRTVAARRLSAAPQSDPTIQGVSYLYLLEPALPAGTHTQARIPALAGKASGAGIAIPDSALVWYGGQRWSYVRIAPERFARRLVEVVSETRDGVVVASGFHLGDTVVTRGAQLLLSEEQRPQGVATVCKDPPECDD